MMSPKNFLPDILLALLLLAGSGASTAPSGPAHMPGLPEQRAAFPAIQGWRLAVDSAVYTPDNLWNIINGAADAYLLYGFVDLHIGEYLSPDSIDVRAELYAHSSAANAFGIYSQERKPEYSFVDVGTEGYIEDGVLNFLAGNYYVKLTSHTRGARSRGALHTVARHLVSSLHQEPGFPSQLALLPPEGKIPRSESYIADSYLGYSFFHSAYVAQYDSGGRTQLFVMEFESPAASGAALKRYLEKIGAASDRMEEGVLSVADPNHGSIGIGLKDRYLCGVVNCEKSTARREYLNTLVKGIASRTRPQGKGDCD